MAGGDGAGCVPGVELCAKGAESGVKINRLRDVSQAARLRFFFLSLSLFLFVFEERNCFSPLSFWRGRTWLDSRGNRWWFRREGAQEVFQELVSGLAFW